MEIEAGYGADLPPLPTPLPLWSMGPFQECKFSVIDDGVINLDRVQFLR